MKFSASQNAIAHKAGVEPIKAVANWTLRRHRYRAPTNDEIRAAGIGVRFPMGAQVLRDEGLLFVTSGETVSAFTLAELGLK